jgi:hypothetical protein
MVGFAYVCALVIVTAVPAAQAVTIDSSISRDIFKSAFTAGNLFGQNFDSLVSGTIVNTVNGVTFSASQGSAVVTSDFLATTPPNGLGSTSFGFFASIESATISFATAITAFAIDVNTSAPTSGDYVAAVDLGSTVASRLVYFGGSSVGEFVGFTSDTPFSSVTISPATDSGAHAAFPYTLDTLIFGEAMNVRPAVPEPSTWVLLASGLGLLLALQERKRRLGRYLHSSSRCEDARTGHITTQNSHAPEQRWTLPGALQSSAKLFRTSLV